MSWTDPFRRFLLKLLVVSAVSHMPVRASDRPDTADTSIDCGTAALYAFLRATGHPIELAQVREALPPRPPDGYSMKDLRDAARALGLRSIGVVERPGEYSPDSPRLAFVKRGEHGHFLVLRPVGHTGRLVQILDFGREPIIIDAGRLDTSPEWSGLVLAPSSRLDWRSYADIVAVVFALLVPLVLIVDVIRKRLPNHRMHMRTAAMEADRQAERVGPP